jgi:hypothetical protein
MAIGDAEQSCDRALRLAARSGRSERSGAYHGSAATLHAAHDRNGIARGTERAVRTQTSRLFSRSNSALCGTRRLCRWASLLGGWQRLWNLRLRTAAIATLAIATLAIVSGCRRYRCRRSACRQFSSR